jgi:Bacterial extracellular solute-binding proteins, family 5 Middle
MARHASLVTAAVAFVLIIGLASSGAAQVATSAGQITLANTVTLAPTWFDPAETPGVITPFLTLYALHDALVKPMPGNAWAPSLAESWTVAKDGLAYEFVLRRGVRFHNGDLLSAEDVNSPSSGTRSHRGPIGACGWPSTWRSIARGSATPSISGTGGQRRASFPGISSSTGRRRHTRTIRPRPGDS